MRENRKSGSVRTRWAWTEQSVWTDRMLTALEVGVKGGDDVNRTLVGWFEYFKHSHRFTFSSLDGWVRMRLRSILRKRRGRKGRGRGLDHHRWRNSFFADAGLFSLVAAHRLVSQSSKR